MPRRANPLTYSNAKLKHLLLAGAVSLVAAACTHFLPPTGKADLPKEIAGQARVVDGDTIRIGENRIRFFGVDAPETSQNCQGPQGSYRCGLSAKEALQGLIGGKDVLCHVKDVDRYNRFVAQCSLGATDVNGWMVEQGWALAYRQYAHDYEGREARAEAAHAGIWAGTFQKPWEYRRDRKAAEFTE